MFLHVTEAKYVGDYRIEVLFNNGRRGVADLSNALVGPIFEPLKNIAEFRKFKVDEEIETVTWPNGADLAPEYIYFQAFKNDPLLQAQFKTWGYIT
ncbi:MAG: DUF2442 domain-containing protein [Gammaproteobacteria bacterium]|nr:DUF2442 domain-containing protein [Gammaproteobacteria bacterium]